MNPAQWTAVDRYLEETLVGEDEALRAAVEASKAAGLPEIQVSACQGKMLHVLARNPGKLVSQRPLLQAVWGPSYLTQTHYLAPVHKPTAPQARAGPHPPTAPHHRAGHGLPVPGLSSGPFMPQPASVIELAPGE